MFRTDGLPADEALLDRMITVIAHRGPDGTGRYVDGGLALGHRRLSIIDVSGGGQPIGNEDNSLQVVFNGEIYNFVELRVELEAKGHTFRTHSDTEVIVHAYEEWGRQCVKRFNGMFAFALWDTRRKELFVSRDHLGIKPLYYTVVGQELLFASEIKAILQHPRIEASLSESALAALFTFRYVPSPHTLFAGINKLPTGHSLFCDSKGMRIERYWDWTPKIRTKWNEADLVREYQSLLEDAVRIQMRSDVPLGLFLSSGVDSAMLLAMMSKHANGPVRTFTIGFEDGENTNEVDDAKVLASMFGAKHSFQILGPKDYQDYYERYMWDLEEPVGNETAAAFYFVSRLAATEVKVALSGQGADEPWAGYDRYKGIKLSKYYSRIPTALTRGFASLVGHFPGRHERLTRGLDSLGERDMLTRLAKVYSFFSEDVKASLYRGSMLKEFLKDPQGTRHELSRLHSDVSGLDPVSQMLYIDTRANLPDDLLMVGDKTSMACSIEGRVPFLDVRLIEFIESLPPELKLRGFTGKYLHKKAALKWLPKEIVYRKKKGFANPIEDWFRHGMSGYVEDCLLSTDSKISAYFDKGALARLIKDDRSGRGQYRRHLYLLVSLELWCRRFLGTNVRTT